MTMWHYVAAFEVGQLQPLNVTAYHKPTLWSWKQWKRAKKKKAKSNQIMDSCQSSVVQKVVWMLWGVNWEMVLYTEVGRRRESIKCWAGSSDRTGRIGAFCKTLNPLIPCWIVLLTMPPLTVSLLRCAVHSLPAWAYTGPSPGWEGVTVGVGLKGWDFLVTLLPTF